MQGSAPCAIATPSRAGRARGVDHIGSDSRCSLGWRGRRGWRGALSPAGGPRATTRRRSGAAAEQLTPLLALASSTITRRTRRRRSSREPRFRVFGVERHEGTAAVPGRRAARPAAPASAVQQLPQRARPVVRPSARQRGAQARGPAVEFGNDARRALAAQRDALGAQGGARGTRRCAGLERAARDIGTLGLVLARPAARSPPRADGSAAICAAAPCSRRAGAPPWSRLSGRSHRSAASTKLRPRRDPGRSGRDLKRAVGAALATGSARRSRPASRAAPPARSTARVEITWKAASCPGRARPPAHPPAAATARRDGRASSTRSCVAAQQLDEGPGAVQVGAHDQRVDECSHQRLGLAALAPAEGTPTTTCAARVTAQHHAPGRQQQRKRRAALLARDRAQPLGAAASPAQRAIVPPSCGALLARRQIALWAGRDRRPGAPSSTLRHCASARRARGARSSVVPC